MGASEHTTLPLFKLWKNIAMIETMKNITITYKYDKLCDNLKLWKLLRQLCNTKTTTEVENSQTNQ